MSADYGQQQVTLDERLRATEASLREANEKIDALRREVAAMAERIDRGTERIRRAVRDQEKAIGTAMRSLPRKVK